MTTSSWRVHARVLGLSAIVAWSIILLSEVSVVDAMRIVAVMVIQASTGIAVLATSRASRRLPPTEMLAVGVPVGMVAALAADQAVIAWRGEHWGWVTPSLAVALAAVARRRSTPSRPPASVPPDPASAPAIDRVAVGWIVVAALLILGGGWYWSSVIAIGLGGTLISAAPRDGNGPAWASTRVIASVLGLAVAVGALVTRPATWWIEDSDLGFFEAMATSFSRWGATGDALAVGHPIRYHWFVYGWTGLVDRVAGTAPWIVLTRAGLAIGALLVAVQLWCILRRLGVGPRVAGPALAGLAILDTFDAWGSGFRLGLTSSPSHLVGFVWLFGVILWWLATRDAPSPWAPALIAGVLVAGATGAKVSHGIAALAFVGSAEVLDARRHRSATRALAVLAAAATAIAAVYLSVFRGAGNLGRSWLQFPISLQGELVDYPGWPVRLAALLMALGFVGAAVASLIVEPPARRADAAPARAAASASLLLGGLLAAGTVSVFASQLYFLHSAMWVALPVGLAHVVQAAGADPDRRRRMMRAASASLLALVVYRAVPSPDSGAPWAIAARLVAPAAGLLAIGVVTVGSVRDRRRSPAPSSSRWVAAASLLLLGVGVGVVNWVDGIRVEYPGFAREREGRIGSPDLRAAAAWIDATLPTPAVVGSNDERPLVVALARRRMLLQTEWLMARHTREVAERDAEFEERKLLQRDFAAAPTEALRERLVAKGVGWFLVRLEPGAEWTSDVGTVRYRNATYVVVDLTDRPAGS